MGRRRTTLLLALPAPLSAGHALVLAVSLLLTAPACAPATINANSLSGRLELFQTYPFPAYEPVRGDSHIAQFHRLIAFAATLDIDVVMAPKTMMHAAEGVWIPEYMTIAIRDDLPGNDLFATLAHELAHALGPVLRDPQDSEVFAETVAQIVTERAGLEVWKSSFVYLYSKGDLERTVRFQRNHAKEIDAVAAYIETGLR